VEGQGGLTWLAVDMALRKGFRGLPGGMTLATLLEEQRGHRHHFKTPRLSIPRILKWMDAYKSRTGKFPDSKSGAVLEAPGETWSGINAALRSASRGYRGHGRALPSTAAAERSEDYRAGEGLAHPLRRVAGVAERPNRKYRGDLGQG
jgi:hypothetical protein